MRRSLIFTLIVVIPVLATLRADDSGIKFRLSDSRQAFDVLSLRKNYIRPVEDFDTRLLCAREVYDFYKKVLDRKIRISPADYERLETLVEEFQDEIALIKIEEDAQNVKSSGDAASALIGGRLALYIRGVSANPALEGPATLTITPAANLSVVNSAKNLWLNITARSVADVSGTRKMKIDEASAGYEFESGGGGFLGRIKAGRIYFLLGHLGLIGDNNFDAFEGVSAEVEFIKSGLKVQGVFSRLSSTNYPRTTEFESCDDYWAGRLSKDFASGNFELGVNALFSGIASEDGASVDLWWRTPFKGRQVVMEYALYRPTKTGIFDTDKNPYDNPYYAFVGGFDAVNDDNFNVFVQLGDVQKGFAPMATSLAYSAQEHLYFDPDTRGVDVSFTYYPSAKDETAPWSTRPPVKNLELPRSLFYELNLVYLWRSASWDKSQARYILRHGRPVARDIRLYIENTVWEKEPTDVWVYDKSVYDEAKLFVVYEF